MGLFSSETFKCELCGNNVKKEYYDENYKICYSCLMIMNNDINRLQSSIAKYQDKANSSKTADDRIACLSIILDCLYEYKVKYDDNCIYDALSVDVNDLIFDVVQHISNARLED